MRLEVRRARWRFAAACAAIIVTTSVPHIGLSAERAVDPPARANAPSRTVAVGRGPASVEAGISSSITGSVWRADNTPLPRGRLRLRNVTTGRIAATTVGNDAGQFVFSDFEPGTYIVELVSDKGRLLAAGNAVVVGRGETVATFVRLTSKVPWFDGFFSNAAATVATAAASLGVTAVAPEQMKCASPPCK